MRSRYHVLTLLMLLPLAAEAAELRDVRIWSGPEGTRVVFDLDAAAEHSLFTLDNPHRVVVDLKDTDRAGGLAAIVQGRGVVKQVRSAPRGGGALRIVLDLSDTMKPKSFVLEPNQNYGHRLVVDLGGASAAAVGPPAPTTAPVWEEKPIVVAIDAGHGGEDPGTQSRSGILEKDVALAIAQRLARMVDAEPGFRAVLIREGDYYIKLNKRVELARNAQADLFVSIHANAFRDRSMRGSAVYVLSPKGASSEHARWLADRENMSDLIGGVVELENSDDTTAAVLIDILQTSALEASHDVGGRLLSAMEKVNPLQRARVQQASFMVLRSPNIPSVLVETAFLTNDHEAKQLADRNYQDRMARSLLEGIKGYFQNYRPQQHIAQQQAQANFHPVSAGALNAR